MTAREFEGGPALPGFEAWRRTRDSELEDSAGAGRSWGAASRLRRGTFAFRGSGLASQASHCDQIPLRASGDSAVGDERSRNVTDGTGDKNMCPAPRVRRVFPRRLGLGRRRPRQAAPTEGGERRDSTQEQRTNSRCHMKSVDSMRCYLAPTTFSTASPESRGALTSKATMCHEISRFFELLCCANGRAMVLPPRCARASTEGGRGFPAAIWRSQPGKQSRNAS